MKLPKLNLICPKDELRPIINYVFINETEVAATDAHALAVLDKQEMFGDTLKDVNNILIRSDHWKLFTMEYEFITVDTHNQYISIIRKGGIVDMCPYRDENSVGKFPNYSAIIPSYSSVNSVEKIGVNPFLLQKLAQALSIKKQGLKLRFDGESRAIYVTPISNDFNSKGIIMPLAINN